MLYPPWGTCRGHCPCLEYSSPGPVAGATHPPPRWISDHTPNSSPTLGFSLLVSSFFMPLLHSDDFASLFACYFCVCISCPLFIGNFKCIIFLFQQYVHLEIA